MNFCDLDIQRNYISFGEINIADSLICPLLAHARRYDRSVGFFSSSVLSIILPGLVRFARHQGKIRLLCSPRLSETDIEAIEAGYVRRERYITERFAEDFGLELQEFSDNGLQLLIDLIAQGTLDIQIAITSTTGEYHDKLGILEDLDGNVIAFYGSANDSENGYRNNYERVRVVKSWVVGEDDYVRDEQAEFQALWANTNPFVRVITFRETAEQKLLEVMERRKARHLSQVAVQLRPYQEQAIEAWVNNQYHGFFVMATGTGKTWTAIFAAKRLVAEYPSVIVICAPYKHLIRQWAEDVRKAFAQATIVMISSENPKWETELTNALIDNYYNPSQQVIAISTILSFNSDRFERTIAKTNRPKLLIVDEAHRFTTLSDMVRSNYPYLLGLSATPYGGKSTTKGDALMRFFGGRVFNLPIEDALGKYLVNYYYHPIFVNTTEEEEESFASYSRKIAACFRNGVLIDPEALVKYLRSRLRILSMAQEKIVNIDNILQHVKERDHVVVYCGDGRLFDENRQRELRHIQFVKSILSRHGHRSSQFTASENMDKRIELVDAFNKGEITALAAIRCLDEGINIPSIKSALILSSNDDYREFVQRRGRILRQYAGKESATIYDVIVLPSMESQGIAAIELRRFLEYARLALNKEGLMVQLNELISQYGLTMEQIAMNTGEEVEASLDE